MTPRQSRIVLLGAVGLLAVGMAGACAFDHDRRDLRRCATAEDCLAGTVCLQGVCARPVDAGGDRTIDAAAADAADAPPEASPPDQAPEAPPNVTVTSPKPGELLAPGNFAFHAEVIAPGVGVAFAWKYLDGTCGGPTVYCNRCPKTGVPKSGTMAYETTKVVSGTAPGELCAGKTLSAWFPGEWLFVVQAGGDEVQVPFRVP